MTNNINILATNLKSIFYDINITQFILTQLHGVSKKAYKNENCKRG